MRAWLEIDLAKIGQNLAIVRRQIGGIGVIAVVKTDAYGHGLAKVAAYLDTQPVDMFAVIDVPEAHRVRQVSQKPILIFGYLDGKDLVEAIEAGFILSLYDQELVPYVERVAARVGQPARVHVKVETGLNRLGMGVEAAADFLTSRRLFPHIIVEGIYSHLAKAGDDEQNTRQLAVFQGLLVRIQGKSDVVPLHLVSSGALHFRAGYFDAVRIGLALYGVEPVLPGLEPVLTCKSVVMQVKTIAPGEGIGYDYLFIASKPTTIAIVAIGYGEGLSRALVDQLTVLIAGRVVPAIGQIAMNLIATDVTGLAVKRGDEVVVLGSQQDAEGNVATLTVNELAKHSRIRHHEIIVRLGQAVPRFYSSNERQLKEG